MARSLQDRIIAGLGQRKLEKYFSDPDSALPEQIDLDLIDEFVANGLRQVAETIPISVAEADFVVDAYGRLSVSPIGRMAPRRLDVLSVSYTPSGLPSVPLAKSVIRVDEGTSYFTSGWKADLDAGYVSLLTCSGAPAYSAGQKFSVQFAVVPTEAEILSNASLMRAAGLFGTASALEEVLSLALREQTVRLEGVPDVRSISDEIRDTIAFMQKRARALLGDYQAAA